MLKSIIDLSAIKEKVIIESIELYRNDELHILQVRSKSGASGASISNGKIKYLQPILKELVIPFFIGKDARELEKLIEGVYVFQNNYKMSSLALFCPIAWVEFSILDMLGRIAGVSAGDFFGKRLRNEIPIYMASGNRGTTPEEEINILKEKIEETGAMAVKFKVGGRMSKNLDSIEGRTEKLIKLSRKILGDAIAIHADANGSYDAKTAVEVGRMLEDINADLYEEPCPFDEPEETKKVADALEIAIGAGEQESSLARFGWLINNKAVQTVQPDLHYFGGFIRTAQIAAMALKKGIAVTPHISSKNIGFAEMALFCSFIPNIGRFHEIKSGIEKTGGLFDPPIRIKNGFINVPLGPGLGISNIGDLINKAEKIF